jgi:hypothetical protein
MSTGTGATKVTAYDDITEAQRKHDVKEAILKCIRGGRRKCQNFKANEYNVPRAEEFDAGRCEIRALGLENCCSFLQFDPLYFARGAS